MTCVATLVFFGTGCTERRSVAEDSVVVDSLANDSLPEDSLEVLLEEAPVPKAADELFDDFFFNYASNRRLQRERTDFPLNVVSYGKTSVLQQNKWATERFFMKQGYYTLVFNSRKQMSVVKDTAVSNVTVEKITFENNQLQQWYFNRVEGLWRLQKISYSSLDKHPDADFLKFYEQFVTDSVYQMEHLAQLVSVSAPDPDDDFSRMEGSVMPEQWPMFAPWMPSGTLYNIHYGSAAYKPSAERIFSICGIANGLATELTFRKESDTWNLVKMEN